MHLICPFLCHCRLNSLPITLADLSAALQVDVHTLGSHYQALCRLLGLQPPLLMAGALLPRAVDRVAAEAAAAGALGGATPAALQRDAEALLGWMDQQVERGQHPMAGVGAALVLAAEMNTVGLGPGQAGFSGAGGACYLFSCCACHLP